MSSTASDQEEFYKVHARGLLQKYYGYQDFRKHQWPAISNALARKDTFLLLNTSGGKSMCFQMVALVTGKTVLVICPLTSLANDQVAHMTSIGVSAIALHKDTADPNANRDAVAGKYSLIYMAPERLKYWQGSLQEMYRNDRLAMFGIDEVHSISQDGSDFRPEYRELHVLRKLCPTTPIMALTATATETVRHDVIKQLQLRNPLIEKSSFDRPNLKYIITPKTSIEANLTRESIGNDACIIYCTRKADVDAIVKHVHNLGLKVGPYHADVPSTERNRVHYDFLADRIQVVVATISFGLGVSKPDVRRIINWGPPSSLEEYVQQTGRAGRDGEKSDCILYCKDEDFKSKRWVMDKSKATSEAKDGFKEFESFTTDKECRRKGILRHFGELFTKDSCDNCDNCLRPTNAYTTATMRFQELKPKIGSTHNPTIQEESLFQHLRAWRKEVTPSGTSAYYILGDPSLRALAAQRPTRMSSFVTPGISGRKDVFHIFGVGQENVKKYALMLIEIISKFCSTHGMTTDQPKVTMQNITATVSGDKTTSGVKRKRVNSTAETSWSMLQSGKKLSEVASERKFVIGTILEHISQCVQDGYTPIPWSLFDISIDQTLNTRVRSTLDRHHKNQKPSLEQIQRDPDNLMRLEHLQAIVAKINGSLLQPAQWTMIKLIRLQYYYL